MQTCVFLLHAHVRKFKKVIFPIKNIIKTHQLVQKATSNIYARPRQVKFVTEFVRMSFKGTDVWHFPHLESK